MSFGRFSLWEPTCMHCVNFALWTRRGLCGRFIGPYIKFLSFMHLIDLNYILFNLIYYLDFVLLYNFCLFMPTFFQKHSLHRSWPTHIPTWRLHPCCSSLRLTHIITNRHSNLTTSSLLFLPQAYTGHDQQTFQSDDFILVVPEPFLVSVHLHGMTLSFLSDRNPLWAHNEGWTRFQIALLVFLLILLLISLSWQK